MRRIGITLDIFRETTLSAAPMHWPGSLSFSSDMNSARSNHEILPSSSSIFSNTRAGNVPALNAKEMAVNYLVAV